MKHLVDSLSGFVSVVELRAYLDDLIDLTIMSHETSPRGYTDPEQKQYFLGKRQAYNEVDNFLRNHTTKEEA